MSIPVLWVSYRPEILARGYADQGFLEEVLAGKIWRPAVEFEFEHHEVRGIWPKVDGAVVIFNGRTHVDHVGVINKELAKLSWCVVMICGDEEWDFPWSQISHPNMVLYVMQARPEHAHLERFIPGGWYPLTRDLLAPHAAVAAERPLDWFFGGQVTHERRQECVGVLRGMFNGELVETTRYLEEGISKGEYFRKMASAKVIPCPSGPFSVDCARAFEALEAGCIPVCDTLTAEGLNFDYWSLLFRTEPPFFRTDDWSTFPAKLEAELDGYPHNSNYCFSFWQVWKRRFVVELHNDILQLQGEALGAQQAQITVLIPTSPLRMHPNTSHIEQVIASIRAQLPLAEILIMCDGVAPEQEYLRANYEEYLRRLFWKCNFEWVNVAPIMHENHAHQAKMTRSALAMVDTPLVMFVEHDTFLEGEIDWESICSLLLSGRANAVQFHENVEIHADHQSILVDRQVSHHEDAEFRRTWAWWQRPHVARTDFYREKLMPLFGRDAKTMIEEVAYAVINADRARRGEAAWWDWRLYIYTPTGPSIRRHGHLDSRGDEPKIRNVYSYDGTPPPGAPQ